MIEAIKRMFAAIKRAVVLNKRTLNEQPKPKQQSKSKYTMIQSIGYRGEE